MNGKRMRDGRRGTADGARRLRRLLQFRRRNCTAGAREAGFTFIEIMVAVMILFILMGVAGFTYVRYVGRARTVAAKNQLEVLSIALSSYYLDTGTYPTTEQGLKALWEKPVLEPAPREWSGPYLEKALPKDPWGNDYQYAVPGPSGLPFGIRCLGADNSEGGEGANQDIVSWQN